MVLAFEPKLNKLFCGVFDGHGGPAAALWLSREMQAIVTKAVEAEAKGNPTSATPPPELERALAAAFPAADEALMSHLETLGSDVLSNAGGRMHGRSCPGPVPTLCRAAAGKVSVPRASLPASRKDSLTIHACISTAFQCSFFPCSWLGGARCARFPICTLHQPPHLCSLASPRQRPALTFSTPYCRLPTPVSLPCGCPLRRVHRNRLACKRGLPGVSKHRGQPGLCIPQQQAGTADDATPRVRLRCVTLVRKRPL